MIAKLIQHFMQLLFMNDLSFQPMLADIPRTFGLSWGNPRSVSTYCGVPYLVFRELRKLGCLVKVRNSQQWRPTDLFNGAVAWRRSVFSGAYKRSALWKHFPETIATLSRRFSRASARLPEYETLFQFEAAVLPPAGKAHLAHLEMSVETALTERPYAESHGLCGFSDKEIERAIAGEKLFLEHCSLLWTNSKWTAEGFKKQGYPEEKIRIFPPACGVPDPGKIKRDWRQCHLVFIGVDWCRKGGDILLDAFKIVRRARTDATLTIIGCNPHIQEPGVKVLGYLRKNCLPEARLLRKALEQATLYCMPTRWDSTGIPFMEGAIYGLPVVMSSGQGRENIFPETMAVHVEDPDGERLAEVLLDLFKNPDRMKAMGKAGRHYVLENYTWGIGIQKIAEYLREAVKIREGSVVYD